MFGRLKLLNYSICRLFVLLSFVLIVSIAKTYADTTFTATLDQAQAIPPSGSTATGGGSVILNTAETQVVVTLNFAGLSSSQTSAEISKGKRGIAGLTEIALPNGIFTQTYAVTPSQVADLKAGLWYFNVNSTTFGGGEIRGQIEPLCAIQPFDLMGWYKGENNANDSSGNNPATLTNGATFTSGKVGQAFLLDGINDYVEIPDALNNTPKRSVSLQAWIKPYSIGTNQTIVSNLNSTNNNGTYHLSLQANGSLLFQVRQSTTVFRQVVTSAGLITANVYTHVAATYDFSNQNIKIYVNNVDIPTTLSGSSLTSLLDSTTRPRIGANTITGSFTAPFNGEIDEVQIYNRALSSGEIQAIYNSRNSGLCVQSTPSGAGSLDKTFGSGGKVITQSGSLFKAFSTVLQTDGKVVMAGTLNTDIVLMRFNADGSPDTSFGIGGTVITSIGSSIDQANSVAIQADGKIVAAGSSRSTNFDFAVVRYNTDGTLDTTFGTGGIVVTPIGSSDDIGYSILLQTDGKIIVGGQSSGNGFAFVRYNTNGSLDTSFDVDGKVTTSIASSSDVAVAATLQSDGKIIAAGACFASTQDVCLARYNSNGSLDTSFDTDGKVITTIGTDTDGAYAVTLQSDGKILTSGATRGTSLDFNFALVRYNSNGSLDTSFGTGGKVITSIGTANEESYSVVLQTDGKILASGYTVVGTNYDFALVRYNSNGSLDSSFGNAGKSVTPISRQNDQALSIAIQPDGKIIVGGNNDSSFVLARFNADATSLPASNLSVSFSNITKSGNTVAIPLGSNQIPLLPNGYSIFVGGEYYEIRTSALYSGNIAISLNLPNVSSSTICSSLRLLHFENGAWTTNANGTPSYNSGNQTCTLTQTVTSLSPFAVGQVAPTAANASVSGRVQTASGRGIANVTLQLTNLANNETKTARTNNFGRYSFTDLEAGQTYILSVTAKRFTFSNPSRVITLSADLTDEDFITN